MSATVVLCGCGCGEPAPLASRSGRGVRRGDPLRFVSGHNSRGRSDLARFVVDEQTGCWLWQGAVNSKGYGRVHVDGEHTSAHRAIYERATGVVLPRHIQVDHECHRPSCVNPTHMRPASAAENNRNKRQTLLTDELVEAIRVADGSDSHIARQFGISRQYANDIRRGRRWRRPDDDAAVTR